MPKVKSADAAASKWSRVTPDRGDDYQMGVQNPRTPWAAATGAAADRYATGVNAAIKDDRFGNGVKKAGDAKWQKKTLDKGPTRFTEGVALSGPDYQAAVAPYLAVIAGTNLPPRFAKGDPRNLDRVKVLSAALRAKKVGGGG